MGKKPITVTDIPLRDIKPYDKNAKKHPKHQIEATANSIKQFGWKQPIVVDKDKVIVVGHCRYLAAKKLGLKTAPCIIADDLTDEEIKAYRLADNKTNESEWDFDLLNLELDMILDIDMGGFGFDDHEDETDDDANDGTDWFEDHGDSTTQEGNDEYNEFTAKFEPKKTTDDCYTPQKVYDAIADWVVTEYGVDKESFVRPFFPGGDYQSFKYLDGCIVCDNPPFSILAEILKFYTEKHIKFFLFALTLFSSSSSACAIGVGLDIVYENGASVATSFLTNLEDARFRTAPDLYKIGTEAVKEVLKEQKRELPKYSYPAEVVTSSMLSYLSQYGQEFKVSRSESHHTRQLDAQKDKDKAIFGSGYLISEKAVAEKWTLSDREIEIIKKLQ